jgi:pyruvate ferredoxin oxidoreductase beta subunit
MNESHFQRMKDLPSTHLLGAGTSMCAGCGGLGVVKQIYDVLGPNVVFVNAAGCMTLSCVYPFTPFQGSWLYTSMASAPAGAQGIRDALDVLLEKGRMEPRDDLQVVVVAGDGSSGGMALSATSAAIDRGLDFIYLCYDNEGYGNTGQQTSAATPLGARTATDALACGNPGHKKDLFAIWAANRPAYAATVIASEPLDLARKIETARCIKGPRLILALAPCPTGWLYDPAKSVEIAHLAVKTGVWPLKEYRDGKIFHSRHPAKRLAVENYLKLQGRFSHLFEPQRDEKTLAAIQAEVDSYWSTVPATTNSPSAS